MRIAILGIKAMPAFAGADRVAERIVENLPGHEYVVYVLRDETLPPPAPNRRYVRIPALRGKHVRAFSYFLLSALHFVLRGNADVVHVHNSEFGFFVPLLKLRRVRVIGTFHGSHLGAAERDKWGGGARRFLRISERVFVRYCDVLTSVAPLAPIDGHDVRFVPNGADPWDGGIAPSRGPLGLPDGPYVLFACGRLDRSKGLHHLLAAYRELADAPCLLVVGDFSHDAAYSAEIEREAAKDDRVVLRRELLDRESLFRALSTAAVFVFPSEFEAMSMVLLEAIGCGTTVVCSDIAENIAVVGHEYPLLFRTRDALHLADVLSKALRGDFDTSAAQQAYDAVRTTFRWDRIARTYERLYAGVIA